MQTPCIKICKLDPKLQYCIGCKRTLEEIQRWAYMTNAEREKIIKELLGR
jgi:predicted Fe-S protein YdhL (DUF1289 family)